MLSEEIIEIYEKNTQERREMIFEHLEKLKPIDEQLITSALEGVKELLYSDTPKNENETDPVAILNSWSMTGKSKQMMAVVEATEELSAFVQKERLAVLNLCRPEAKEKTNE